MIQRSIYVIRYTKHYVYLDHLLTPEIGNKCQRRASFLGILSFFSQKHPIVLIACAYSAGRSASMPCRRFRRSNYASVSVPTFPTTTATAATAATATTAMAANFANVFIFASSLSLLHFPAGSASIAGSHQIRFPTQASGSASPIQAAKHKAAEPDCCHPLCGFNCCFRSAAPLLARLRSSCI